MESKYRVQIKKTVFQNFYIIFLIFKDFIQNVNLNYMS